MLRLVLVSLSDERERVGQPIGCRFCLGMRSEWFCSIGSTLPLLKRTTLNGMRSQGLAEDDD